MYLRNQVNRNHMKISPPLFLFLLCLNSNKQNNSYSVLKFIPLLPLLSFEETYNLTSSNTIGMSPYKLNRIIAV